MTASLAEPAVVSGDYLAVLFDPSRGWGERMAQLASDYPHWFGVPMTPAERAELLFAIFSNPSHLTWEVWKEEEIVGLIVLTQIHPKMDALLHFAFFDRNLVGKTRLLQRFLAYCFTDLRFQRISVQVPEFYQTLLSYYRRKLGFRYEGETVLANHQTVGQIRSLMDEPIEAAVTRFRSLSPRDKVHVWLASRGSRRERLHWHEGKWHDVLCLRLLAEEFHPLGDSQCLGSPQPSVSVSRS